MLKKSITANQSNGHKIDIHLGIETICRLCAAEEERTVMSNRCGPGAIEVICHQKDIVHNPAKYFMKLRTVCQHADIL